QNTRLHLAVHSEKLVVADGIEVAGVNRLTGTVTETLYQGESIRVFWGTACDVRRTISPSRKVSSLARSTDNSVASP
ncbi:TOBE domain-containing protein, partial [Rhizobium ruizarguesonis]